MEQGIVREAGKKKGSFSFRYATCKPNDGARKRKGSSFFRFTSSNPTDEA
jgi:hypothetical protein